MKRFMFLTAIIVILLAAISKLQLGERATLDTRGNKGETIKVNSVHNQDLHKNQLPYRDDADYSEHGNEIFPLGE